jgi:MSHA biogenesis protein MshL
MSKHFKGILLVLCLSFFLGGCAAGSKFLAAISTTERNMQKETAAIDKEKSQVTQPEPRKAPEEKPPAVEEKKVDPLAGKTITLTADSARFTEIFSAIAQIAGLDLVIDSRLMTQEAAAKQFAVVTRMQPRTESQVQTTSKDKSAQSIVLNIGSRTTRGKGSRKVEETQQEALQAAAPQNQTTQGQGGSQTNALPIALRPVNVAFSKTPLNQALENICESLNVFYEIRGKCLYVTGTKARTFHLNFVSTQKETKIAVGGDVIANTTSGSGDSGSTTSPLTGQFSISSTTPTASNDVYAQVEQIVNSSLTEHGTYSLNRSIGLLEISDRKSAIDRVEHYIKTLKAFYNSQVLITGKILEVSLNDTSIYGIDWSSLNGSIGNFAFNPIQQNLSFSTDNLTPAISITATNTKSGFDATLEALQRFGDIKVLSNPRIRVTNGQPAMISVGTNTTYVQKVERTSTVTDGQTENDTNVTLNSVFDGVLFGVQPYIDLETNEVNISITPIKSRIVDMQETTIDDNTFTLPTIDLKEATTQLRVKSGTVVVMGGLISKNLVHANKAVPILGTLPGVGYLFSQRTESVQTSELVILLEPVILAQ